MYMWNELITKYNTKKSSGSKKCPLVHRSYLNKKIKYFTIHGKDLYTVAISLTPAFQKLET